MTAVAIAGPTITSAQGCSQVVRAGIVRAQGCFTQSGSVYTATSTVDLNGIQVMATNDSRLTIDTGSRRVAAKTASGAAASIKFAIPGFPAASRTDTYTLEKLDFAAPQPGPAGDERELKFGYAKVGSRVLAGLSPVGTVDSPIKLTQASSEGDSTGQVTIQYSLPGALQVRGTSATVGVNFNLYPNGGARFDGVEIHASELTFRGIVGVRTLDFIYSAAQQLWSANLEIAFPTKSLSNPDADTGTVGARARVQEGRLRELGATFGIPVEIFPQIYFTRGSLRFADDPFNLEGSVGFRAGEEIPKSVPIVGGNRLIGGDVNAEFKAPSGTPSAPVLGYFRLGGGIDLFENIRLANAEFKALFYDARIQPPRGRLASMTLNANAGIGLPRFTNSRSGNIIYLGGGINGWWEGVDYNPATGRYARALFNLEGNVRLSLFRWDVTGAQTIVSNRGIAACVKPIWWSPYIGAGYQFRPPKFSVLGGFSSCGITAYRETSRPASRSRDPWARLALRGGTEGSEVLDLAEDEQTLRIKGTDDVPSFDLESRDGERIRYDWTGKSPVFGPERRWVILGDPSSDTAYVLMRDPEGRWAITDSSDATAIEEVGQAKTVDPPEVEAEVSGKGLRKKLHWSVEGMRPNDQLRLYETLGEGNRRRVFSTRNPEGSRRFVTALGPEREHQLHGIVTRQGSPFEDELLDEFTVRLPNPPARPRGVRAHRLGTRVIARWDRVPNTRGYVAVLENDDGTVSVPKVVPPNRTKAVFRRAPIEPTMQMKVFATGRLGFPSNPRVRRFRAIPREQTPDRSVREMLRSARVLANGNLAFIAPCPGHGHCRLSVQVLRGGHEVGSGHAQAMPESRGRVRITLPSRLRAELRRGAARRFTIDGTFRQAGRVAEHRVSIVVSR